MMERARCTRLAQRTRLLERHRVRGVLMRHLTGEGQRTVRRIGLKRESDVEDRAAGVVGQSLERPRLWNLKRGHDDELTGSNLQRATGTSTVSHFPHVLLTARATSAD